MDEREAREREILAGYLVDTPIEGDELCRPCAHAHGVL